MPPAPHRHRFVRGTRTTLDPAGPFRACVECRAVQRKVSGRWVQGSQAANPTEAKNIARRLLGPTQAERALASELYGRSSREASC